MDVSTMIDPTPEWHKKVNEILTDPAASWWLKGALAGAVHHATSRGHDHRDPVDVANDMDVLNAVLNEWLGFFDLRISPPLSPALVGRDPPGPARESDRRYVIKSDYKVRIHAYEIQKILPFLSIGEAEELALRDLKYEVHHG
jgi:hypothetical protein